MVLIALSLLFSISLCVHAVRTAREMYWLFIRPAWRRPGGALKPRPS